jgi:hypothetical protein
LVQVEIDPGRFLEGCNNVEEAVLGEPVIMGSGYEEIGRSAPLLSPFLKIVFEELRGAGVEGHGPVPSRF